MTHNEAVLRYFRSHKNGLTTMKMMDKLGIASPTKVISNLRKQGYCILGKRRTAISRYGKRVDFLEYTLIDK